MDNFFKIYVLGDCQVGKKTLFNSLIFSSDAKVSESTYE